MSSVFVISDVHGNYDGLIRALENHKIIDKKGNRQLARKHKVISIGDLANCVEKSKNGDAECLRLIPDVIDYLIVGNHEFPYLDQYNCFNGFHWHPEISGLLLGMKEMGQLIPSYLHNGTLISHAGLSRKMLPADLSAETVDGLLRDHWSNQNYDHSWFSSIGYVRGGRSSSGGIIWCDFDKEFLPTDFPQVVGHTSRNPRVQMKGNAICIDVGAKDPDANKPFILEVK